MENSLGLINVKLDLHWYSLGLIKFYLDIRRTFNNSSSFRYNTGCPRKRAYKYNSGYGNSIYTHIGHFAYPDFRRDGDTDYRKYHNLFSFPFYLHFSYLLSLTRCDISKEKKMGLERTRIN